MKKTLGELAKLVGGRLEGDPSREVMGVAGLAEAGPADVAFAASGLLHYRKAAAASKAGCLVVPLDWNAEDGLPRAQSRGTRNPKRGTDNKKDNKLTARPLATLGVTNKGGGVTNKGGGVTNKGGAAGAGTGAALLRVADPNRAMVAVAAALCEPLPQPKPGVHPRAVVAETAVLGRDIHIGACAVVGERVRLGDRTRIRAGAVVADEAVVGADCDIYPGVVIRERVRMGDRVVVHAGTVIGADGFGYLPGAKGPEKIPQLGTVEIGDDVELGACVAVDRARFGATRIGPKVKVDNLVQIAHNVEIGEGTVIVSQVAIAGSTRIGRGCVIGGQAAIDGHLEIGDGVRIAAKAGVTKDVPAGMEVSGYPARPHREDLRREAALGRMEEVLEQLKRIEARLASLEAKDRP